MSAATNASAANSASQVNPKFWNSKKVFVTGHTGFKGGWLSFWLHSMGAKVQGYSLDPETKENFFDALKLQELVNDKRGDINNFELLTRTMIDSSPEIVFHMAAQPLVRRSYREPVKTYMDNVMGTISVLEAIRKTPSVKTVVVITTDKCYENKEWVWPYRENEPLGGYDPYSSSKACAEIATAAWRNSFFKNEVLVATVRAGNVIGGGDWSEDRLLPDGVRAISQGKPLIVRNPNAVRPWQHVLEPLSGYMLLAEKLHQRNDSNKNEVSSRYAGAFNFGPSDVDARPVCEVLNLFKQHWGNGFDWKVESDQQNLHEAHLLKLDSSKAKFDLKWNPKLNLSQAIQMTAEWYRGYGEAMSGPGSLKAGGSGGPTTAPAQRARQMTLDQIQKYLGGV